MREMFKSVYQVCVIGLICLAVGSASASAGDDLDTRSAGGEGGTGPQTSTDGEQGELFIYCPQGISGECQRLSKKQLKEILSQKDEKTEDSKKD